MKFELFIFAIFFTFINCDKSLILPFDTTRNSIKVIDAFEKALEMFLFQRDSAVRFITKRDNFNLLDLSLASTLPFELLSVDFFTTNKNPSPSFINAILYDKTDEILTIFAQNHLQAFRLDGFFWMISLGSCNYDDQRIIFGHLWKSQIFNVNIICRNDSDSNTIMMTFFPYQRENCGNSNPILINKFTNNSWIDKNFFPRKFQNLHNCSIKAASFYYPPITMRETRPDGSYRYFGSEMELAEGLAYALNFHIDHQYINQTGASGMLLDNGTATGILKKTLDGEVDMLMAFYYLTYLRAKYLSFSQSHYSVPLVIMIPFGAPFTSFEKLFNPFQSIVWICLISTVVIGAICISIIYCQNEKIRNFIFGSGVNTPYINLLNVLINGYQDVLPKRNFARTLLMIFMLFSFVLRTLYQGSLFQFLQADNRNAEVQSIDEMMEKNFVFYIRETLEHNIKQMNFYPRRKVVKFSDYPALRAKTLDPNFNAGIIMPLLEVIYLNQQNFKNFTYKVLKEYLFDIQIVCYFPKNFHLVEAINTKIGILKSAGLVPLWMDKYIDKTYLKIKHTSVEPRVMSIDQLLGGFEILVGGLFFSIPLFVFELISRYRRMTVLRKIFMKL